LQRLLQGRLEQIVRFLRDPVFMRLPGSDPRRAEAVVLGHLGEARRQRPPSRLLQLVGGRRQVVHAHPVGHPAKRPQRVLQPAEQRLERLAEGQLHEAPAAVGQHQLEEQVHEQRPGDRHPQLRRVREVDRRHLARLVPLREIDLLVRPAVGAKVAYSALQRPQLPRRELPRMTAA
jgi:hypothetical protein